ncbi:hypothetical protein AU497_15805 [Lonsdalea populi]|nr:hypothetical protein AU497_15805 [Lonsdalea populi]
MFDLHGAALVFSAGAIIALGWLILSFTMQEPPYLSSLRITLSDKALQDPRLEQKMRGLPGVAEVIIVPDELSAYVKIDNKQTNRKMLEQRIDKASTSL